LRKVEYFRRLNGRFPTQEWLDKQEFSVSAGFSAKFRMIEVEGLNLLQTNVLKKIIGQPNLYEIKFGGYRIITYHEITVDTFFMLNGFRKHRMNEKMEVEKGVRLMKEYLLLSGGNK
jgi:mRNA-degrading endonuclease RelE of RelBE toxin-antitoxin system